MRFRCRIDVRRGLVLRLRMTPTERHALRRRSDDADQGSLMSSSSTQHHHQHLIDSTNLHPTAPAPAPAPAPATSAAAPPPPWPFSTIAAALAARSNRVPRRFGPIARQQHLTAMLSLSACMPAGKALPGQPLPSPSHVRIDLYRTQPHSPPISRLDTTASSIIPRI